MPLSSGSSTLTDSPAHADDLFQKATAAGHAQLERPELVELLSRLGIDLEQEDPVLPEGATLALGLVNTREFGMVIHGGVGGLDAELGLDDFRRDRATVWAAVELTDADDFLALFRRTLAYRKFAALAERAGKPLPDDALRGCFARMLELATTGESATQVLQQLQFDVLGIGDRIQARNARCTFTPPAPTRLPRPIQKIDKLLHPQSIGIIGVSASKMNFGRIILHNLVDSGYSKERMTILRPGETEIDGVRCVPGLTALEQKLDLLIVAVAADAVYGLVDEIIATDTVETVMLIPGGLGETEKSREAAAAMAARINAAHAGKGGGPVFLGANCLGVVSHPGEYDSWFIPLERLPKPQKKPQRTAAMISQSGAFMITRLSRNPWLDPSYMLALGNQTDLTHGDMLSYFAERPEIETIGLYIEGFKDGDGLDFTHAIRKAVLAGKQIVVYKSGRTAAGIGGVMGHTASIAGDPVVCEAVLRHAGAMVAEDFEAFDDLLYIAGALHHKKVGGQRLGAISGAGFEAVGMADSIASDSFTLEMGELEPATVTELEDILAAKRLDTLVEIRNPIDINPGADDEAHMQITAAFANDPNIDAVMVGLDPTAPSVRALAESHKRPGFDISDLKSSVHLMPPLDRATDKPIIGIIDGGTLYDPMAEALMDQGVCVFRNCARGTRALARYVESRTYTESLKQKN